MFGAPYKYTTSLPPSHSTTIPNQGTPKTKRKKSINNKSATIEKQDTPSNNPSIDKYPTLNQKDHMRSGSGTDRHCACIKAIHTLRDSNSTQSVFGGRKGELSGGHCTNVPLPMPSTPKSKIKGVANSKIILPNIPSPLPKKTAPHGASKHHKQEEEQSLYTFKGSSITHSNATEVNDKINGSNPTSSSSKVNVLQIRDMPKSTSSQTQVASHVPSSPKLTSRHSMNNSLLTTQRESNVLFPETGGQVGIRNLGNTCFMNSMLQCLGQTGEMTQLFLRTPPRRTKLVQAYSDLMRQMWRENSYTRVTFSHPLYPTKLKECFSKMHPQFSGYSQHDAQEFMRILVSSLHEELKQKCELRLDPPEKEDPGLWYQWYMKIENSSLARVFVGQVRSSLKCKHCETESNTFDPFWELSVSIPQKKVPYSPMYSSYNTTYHSTYSYSSLSTTSPPPVHLDECLAQFTSIEDLHGDESPYCLHCESLQTCSKRMTIERIPRVLVIYLKRFSANNSKLTTKVTIPCTLDLAKYVTDSRDHSYIYDLYAITHHSGNVYFGHYTASCKHYTTGKWHTYSDSCVTQMRLPPIVGSDREREISSDTAYVLFYRQRDSHIMSRKC